MRYAGSGSKMEKFQERNIPDATHGVKTMKITSDNARRSKYRRKTLKMCCPFALNVSKVLFSAMIGKNNFKINMIICQ